MPVYRLLSFNYINRVNGSLEQLAVIRAIRFFYVFIPPILALKNNGHQFASRWYSHTRERTNFDIQKSDDTVSHRHEMCKRKKEGRNSCHISKQNEKKI